MLLELPVLKSRKTDRKSLVTPRAAIKIVASNRILKVSSRSSLESDSRLMFLCVCVCLLTLWHIRNRGVDPRFFKKGWEGWMIHWAIESMGHAPKFQIVSIWEVEPN